MGLKPNVTSLTDLEASKEGYVRILEGEEGSAAGTDAEKRRKQSIWSRDSISIPISYALIGFLGR